MTANHNPQISVAIHGATGRMGGILLNAINAQDDIRLVAMAGRSTFIAVSEDGSEQGHDSLESLLADVRPDVVVDFSSRDAVVPLAIQSAKQGANLVTGTSGIVQSEINVMEAIAGHNNIGVMVGPNFSLGAAVLENAVSEAGRHFDTAEIIEMHHAGKADAPSGSALTTAKGMLNARNGRPFVTFVTKAENLEHVRGGNLENITIHSVRMPGLMAHQQVMLGGPGETLTFRHDVIDRESYMPGVLLAIREIGNRTGKLTYGLGALLWPEREKE